MSYGSPNRDARMDGYPRRPRFFAFRFVRAMSKACLAQELGPDACWMLTVIVGVEDTGGYRKPVTFWNEQLAAMSGLGSVSSLKRVRDKVTEAGWLHYEPGAKGRAAKYWVLIPPEIDGLDDGPSDEQPGEYSGSLVNQKSENSGPKLNQNSDYSGSPVNQKADRIRTECEPESGQNPDHILPLPLPFPLKDEDSETRPPSPEEFSDEWNKLVPFSPIKIVSPSVKRMVRFRCQDPDWVKSYRDAMERIASVPFLCGAGESGWKINAEFFLREDTVGRILNGSFDGNNDRTGKRMGSTRPGQPGKVRSGLERGDYDNIPDLGKAPDAPG